MKWVTYEASNRSEVKSSNENSKALGRLLLKDCVEATHSNEGNRIWSILL